MTEFTRPATWEDVKRVAALLNEAGAAYALVGGYALAAHGYVRFSDDVDILVDPSPENARKWIAALAQPPDGASKERDIEGIRIPVLSIEGLLLTKEGMREKDRADRRVLQAALSALRDRT